MVFTKFVWRTSKLFMPPLAALSGALGIAQARWDETPDEVNVLQRKHFTKKGTIICDQKHIALGNKIKKAKEAVNRFMTVAGAPGVSVGVARSGQTVWKEGFGFADVETGAKCTGESVMRIASISKCMTAAIAGKLVERGKLDLDKSIHEYLSEKEFPKKSFGGSQVTITPRQLLCHLSGVRHYPKKYESDPDSEDHVEFMSNKRFSSVIEALEMFKNDPLLSEPGKQYHYTTHGYTLLSAVLEKAEGREFKEMLQELWGRINMRHTQLDDAQEPIVAHRTRYYMRNSQHKLENVREVDNSYKLAGGGILSSVGDLLKFANAILYSYKNEPLDGQKPLLKRGTVDQLWKKHSEHFVNGKKRSDYGLGWSLAKMDSWDGDGDGERNGDSKQNGERRRKFWYHGGGAVGASSILLIRPVDDRTEKEKSAKGGDICVAILVNCQNCSCLSLATELAEIFE